MNLTCRFDWALADAAAQDAGFPACDRAVVTADGKPVLTHYFHGNHLHWCVPAAEAEGIAADFEEMVERGLDAAERAGLRPAGAPCTYRAHWGSPR